MTMFKQAALALAAATTMGAAVPVSAAAPSHAASPSLSSAANEEWDHGDRGRHRGWDRDRGNGRAYYGEPVYRNTRVWEGRDGRYYCRRSNGTTGLIIGAAGGALLGREVAGRRGDRTLGMVLGGAGGALIGREIDRGGSRCR